MYVSFSKINTTIATKSDKLLKVNHLSVATRTFFITTYCHFIATKLRKPRNLR